MNYILKQSKCSNGFVSWHLMSCSSDADKLNSIIALDEPSILICNFPKITPWSSLMGQCKVETVNEPEIQIQINFNNISNSNCQNACSVNSLTLKNRK